MIALTILERYEFNMEVKIHSSILELKEKNKEKFSYPREKQRMRCNDEVMENHHTIEHNYPIFNFDMGAKILVEAEEVSVKLRCSILGDTTTL